MRTSFNVKKMVIAAVLGAIGIIIPLIFPKIIIEPVASYTLASHVAIFIAMFISPAVAAAVSGITTLGFFIAGFPLGVVARAATHVVFALAGALVLKRKRGLLDSLPWSIVFSLAIAWVHAACEVLVATPFFMTSDNAALANGYMMYVVLAVGVGTVVHSIVDFWISWLVWKPLRRLRILAPEKAEALKSRP